MGSRAPRESLVVEVLGPFRVRVGERPVDLPTGRQRVLLAALAMSAGAAVSVDRLTDTVWGDDLPANVRRTIHTYVTRLRHLIGPDAIGTEPAGYVLRAGPDDVDALRFLRLVERSGREPDVERELLTEALRLWRGDPFEDLVGSDRLRSTEGQRLAERRLTATERRIDLDLADGRTGEVIAELRDLTGRHPLREPLWTRLLVALAASGRQAEALEQYESVRSRLADELGVDPGADLQRIHLDLLSGAAPDGPSTGVERRGPQVPHQIPAAGAGFVGRVNALAELDEALTGAAGIVAVHGTGGVGKTTLALHWAHRVADRFPDGQLYLNLHGYEPGNPVTPAAALDTLLRGLGVVGDEIPADVHARGSMLRSILSGRRALVLLDNARSAEQVRPLLPGPDGPVVLVTSRSQLRGLVVREGARRIGLDQLDPDESQALLAAALSAGQVAHEPATLRELADRCGHLPLALAIAAERANRDPSLGLDDLIGELRTERERLDALDAGDESIDLRAVFTWSYRALDAKSARMFQLLGLYPGPDLGVPAAAALAGTTTAKTRRLLDHLVDGNLVQQRRGGRYELHDLMREFAGELAAQLDGSERQTALDRLVEWFVHSAANGRQVLVGKPPLLDLGARAHAVTPAQFGDRERALAWFDAECPSMMAAIRLAVDLGSHQDTCHLVFAAWHYLLLRRLFDEMRDALPLAESSAGQAGALATQAQVANVSGMMHAELLDSNQAVADFRQALALFERAGHDLGQEAALENLGTALTDVEQTEEAADCLERAIEVRRRFGDAGAADPMYKLANVYIVLKRYDEAADLCERAIEMFRRRGDSISTAMAMLTLGEVRVAQVRASEAIELVRASIDLFRSGEDRWYEGAGLTILGRALRDTGQLSQAREVWQQALDLFDELGAPDGRYFSRTELVELLAGVES